MLRTQIQITNEQHRLLRTAAQREGVSISEAVRRCITRFFQEERPQREDLYSRAANLVGGIEDPDGATDLSERHDDYLTEVFR